MIFYFFYIVWKKIDPFWRSLKKKLIHRFLTLERVYFFPFEKRVRNFFQNLKNKYEFFFKTPIVKKIHSFVNRIEMIFGLRHYKFAQTWTKDQQYNYLKTFLWHLFGMSLEFILVFWLYKMPINLIITNVYLAKFLYHLWPESFLSNGIERLYLVIGFVMYFKIYYLYRHYRIDETLFVLETKQNYYQAQAIEN